MGWLIQGQYLTYTTTTGDGELVALILNWKPWASLWDYSFTLKELGVKNLKHGQKAKVVNLWDKEQVISDIYDINTKIKVGKLESHESFIVRVSIIQDE